MSTILIFRSNPFATGRGDVYVYKNKSDAIDNIINYLSNPLFKYSIDEADAVEIRQTLEKRNYYDHSEMTFELFQTNIIPKEYIHI